MARRQKMDSDETVINLVGPHHRIAIAGASRLSSFLFELIPEWPLVSGAEDVPPAGRIDVRMEGDHWRISSPLVDLDEYELDDGYMVANSLIGAVIAGYVAQDPELVSIHAGAVRIGDGLVLMLGDNQSGKSTFSTVLAALGQRFYADDRLVVDLSGGGAVGCSLAIAPKVRLPLPLEASDGYRDFIETNSILSWPEMAVLRLGPEQAAEFGEALPIKAIIALQRGADARQPELSALGQATLVRLLLEQVFAPHLSQQAELSACVALAQSVECLQLSYASAFEAAETVIAHFSGSRER